MPIFPRTDEKSFTVCKLIDVEYEIKEVDRKNPKDNQNKTYIKHCIYVVFNCLSYEKGKVVPVRKYLNQVKHFTPEDDTGKFLIALGWEYDKSLNPNDLDDLDEDNSDIPSKHILEYSELDNPEAIEEREDSTQPHQLAKDIEVFLKERIGIKYYAKVEKNDKGYAVFIPSSFKRVESK